MIFKNLRVLIVDDSLTVRMMLKQTLAELGVVHITEAANGGSALELLQESYVDGKKINLVFLDWNMPHMSGLEVLKICRKIDLFEELKIIMVTAVTEEANVVEAISTGANDYIVKPFSKNIIKAKIDRLKFKD